MWKLYPGLRLALPALLPLVWSCGTGETPGAAGGGANQSTPAVSRPVHPSDDYPRSGGKVRLGQYTLEGFKLVDQPSALANIVDEYHVNRAVVAGQAVVVEVDIPVTDFAQEIDRAEAQVFCVDAAGNNISGTRVPVTLHRVPGTGIARTKVLDGDQVLGKSIVVAITPDVANREFEYAYVLLGAPGCLIKVAVEHDQFL